MGVSRGKQFESIIRDSFEKNPDISIDRFADPMAGYAGIRNICDFGVYKYPLKYYIECKAFSGNTLNFQSAITKDQWIGLREKAKIRGVVAGVMIWFIDHDITSFVTIQELVQLKEGGSKSLNVKDITDNRIRHFEIPGKKKRVLFSYDIKPFLSDLNDWAYSYWEEELKNGHK